MKVNIVARKKFPKILFRHQIYNFFGFKPTLFRKNGVISSREKNYMVDIGKNNVNFFFTDDSSLEDYDLVVKFVEDTFKNDSVGIYTDKNYPADIIPYL